MAGELWLIDDDVDDDEVYDGDFLDDDEKEFTVKMVRTRKPIWNDEQDLESLKPTNLSKEKAHSLTSVYSTEGG